MKKIYLISGQAQHGKDSTANFLKQKFIGKTLIFHNADYLKYIAKQYMGWDGNKDEIGRNILQLLGTEKVRLGTNKPLFWTEKSCDIIDIFYNDFDYFIIPDTRFKNEIFYPKARFPDKVITIRVIRKNYESQLNNEQKNHLSEIDLINFPHDFYIESESGLNNLEKEVDNIIDKL
jgi:hypothetical protein